MSRLTDLIAQAKAKDKQMGADLEREFQALSSRLPFGLNFEKHRPEAVELPQRPIRKGDKVRVLPKRGSAQKGDSRLWRVANIVKSREVAEIELLDALDKEAQTVALADLVVVAEFRDTIYPGVVSTGKVQRGGEKPYHTVINGENYHVLKALTWTHRGKVDVIYIDPPYNSGAKDWKYNNDYVEGDDLYRHSKWLAMMERRLLLARELLNPADSVLIVTIDEKEYLRLGLLLEQTFPAASNVQMVTTVIKPEGTGRKNEFSRTNEFLFFVMFGDYRLVPTDDDMVDVEVPGDEPEDEHTPIEWRNLRRRERESVRGARPNQFYAIFVDNKTGRIRSVGDALADDVPRRSVEVEDGCTAHFPLAGPVEMLWSVIPERMRFLASKGYARFNGRIMQFLNSGTVAAIERGDIEVTGYDDHGGVIASYKGNKTLMPKTLWLKASHNAQASGSLLLKSLIGDRVFPFPKSLYAIEDSLRFFISSKPNAVVIDFFSGSGTTAHAVMRLNKQHGGRRQSIMVTNNEVAAEEQEALRNRRLRPGDPDWEKWGICDYITKPRVRAAITGETPDGQPIDGDYKFNDEFPMADGLEENAEFFTLTYETPVAVSHHVAFARIAPMLWLRAGSRGRRIEKLPAKGWEVVDAYGLLIELDTATDFLKAVTKAKDLRLAYIVTDDERRFQALARRLPHGVEAIRLYESYLTNFSFANGD